MLEEKYNKRGKDRMRLIECYWKENHKKTMVKDSPSMISKNKREKTISFS